MSDPRGTSYNGAAVSLEFIAGKWNDHVDPSTKCMRHVPDSGTNPPFTVKVNEVGGTTRTFDINPYDSFVERCDMAVKLWYINEHEKC